MANIMQPARGIVMIARQYGLYLSAEAVCDDLREAAAASVADLAPYFAQHGLSVTVRRLALGEALRRPYLFPCIALTRDGGALIVLGPGNRGGAGGDEDGEGEGLHVLDPSDPSSSGRVMARGDLADRWAGTVLLIGRRTGESAKDRPFGWSWFWPELKRHGALLGLVLGLSLVVHTLAFTPIIYIQIALDKVLGYQALSTLTVLTIGVALALVFNGVLGILRDRLMRHVAVTIEARLAADSFDKVLDLPLTTLAGGGESRLEQALSASTTVRTFLGGRLLPAVFDLSGVLVFLPILFVYDVALGLLVAVFSLLMGAVSLGFKTLEKAAAARAGQLDQARAAVVRETFANIAAVKTLSQEVNQRKAFRAAAARAIRAAAERERLAALAQQINGVLQQTMTVAIVFTGVWLVLNGGLTAGAVIAVNMIGARVVQPVIRAIGLIAELDRVRSTVERLEETWNARPERRAAGGQRTLLGGFELSGLSVAYDGGTALRDVTLSVPARQALAVVGASGAGKTTLLRVLQGLARPTAGTITVDGTPLGGHDMQHYRRQVALVTARPTFFAGTIADNLKRVRPEVGEREMHAALDESGFADLLPRLPDGLGTTIDATASTLPAAYRQMLGVSRALLSEPRVLLLDEAFTDIDKPHLLRLRDRLGRLAEGRTLVLVTHDLFFARCLPRIIVLDQGRVVGDGGHDALLGSCPVYAGMWQVERRYHGLDAEPAMAPVLEGGAA